VPGVKRAHGRHQRYRLPTGAKLSNHSPERIDLTDYLHGRHGSDKVNEFGAVPAKATPC
jgi:hypothetical protein